MCGRWAERECQPLCFSRKFFAVTFFVEEVLLLFLLLIVLEIGCFDDALPLSVLWVVFGFVFVVFLLDFAGAVVEGCGGVSVVSLVLFCFFSASLS